MHQYICTHFYLFIQPFPLLSPQRTIWSASHHTSHGRFGSQFRAGQIGRGTLCLSARARSGHALLLSRWSGNLYSSSFNWAINKCFFLAGFTGLTLPYFSRQLIAREVDLERIRRAAPKGSDTDATTEQQKQQQQKYAAPAAKKRQAKDASPRLPNHLQTLKPKQITEYNGSDAPKQQVRISVTLPPLLHSSSCSFIPLSICMPCIYLAAILLQISFWLCHNLGPPFCGALSTLLWVWQIL